MKQNIIDLFRCTIALAALLIVGTASALGAETYSITKADTQNGSYSVTVNGEEAETAVAGATVTITATPDTGYEVDGTPVVSVTTDWGRANARAMTRGEIPTETGIEVTAGEAAGTWTFTMPNDDVTVSVYFKKSNYAISVSTVDGGSISAKKGDAAVTTAQYGDSITLGNTPNTGWQFASYSVKDAAGAAVTVTNGKFAMPAGAVTVSATFSKINYAVTIAESITGGAVTVDKTIANYGDTITLTITPAKNYMLGTLVVKDAAGNPIEVTNGEFVMPAGTVTISATFVIAGFEITVGPGEYATFYKEEALLVEDDDAELYTITSVTDTEAVLSDKLNVVAANTPMLVYNKGAETKTFLLIPTEDQADQVNVADEFKGTLEAQEMPASTEGNDYYVCTGKEFVWVMNEGRIGANRCWLEIIAQAAGARANTRSITGGGETTSMKAVDSGELTGDSYYDLQGRKVEKPNRKGIYVKDGRKVIVR